MHHPRKFCCSLHFFAKILCCYKGILKSETVYSLANLNKLFFKCLAKTGDLGSIFKNQL